MSYGYLEHPDITRVRKYGLPEADVIRCPICHKECDTFYKSDGEIIGCDVCVVAVESWECENDF